MLIIRKYHEIIRADGIREIYIKEPVICPDCGIPLTGYDHRRRTVIDDKGDLCIYSLCRFYCRKCRRLHLALPEIMRPQKRYAAHVIGGAVEGSIDFCPADNSTIRRWKKAKAAFYPPALPPAPDPAEVSYSCTGAKEEIP